MGKAVRRAKLLRKSITLPSLRIHINCRLLQGMLALMLTAGSMKEGRKVLPRMVFPARFCAGKLSLMQAIG